MEFEFDPEKARINLAQHGVDFSEVEPVFFDERAFSTRSDRMTAWGQIEERYIVTGRDALGRIVSVVYTVRLGRIRLVSARPAHRKERRHYERG